MTREEANLLKEKFYAATATPEEERQLAQWLRSEDCPEEWTAERRALLALLPDEENAALPEGFALRLAQRLEQERKATRHIGYARVIRRWSAVAAMFILFGGATVLWTLTPHPGEQEMAKAPENGNTPLANPVAAAVKTETPQPEAIPTPATPAKPKRKCRRQAVTAVPVAETAVTETELMPAEAESRPTVEQSLEDHLQRTMQSRERLIAEARSYMSGNCLNRSMPPQEFINETQE